MALKSMTGFGEGAVSAAGVRVTVEMSSVNRKQLDINVNLPESSANKSLSAATRLIIINIRAADRPKGDPLYLVSSKRMTLQQLRVEVAKAVQMECAVLSAHDAADSPDAEPGADRNPGHR